MSPTDPSNIAELTVRRYLSTLQSTSGNAGTTLSVERDPMTGQPLGTIRNTGGVPAPQSQHTAPPAPNIPRTEPVTASGEFVLEQTDLVIEGYGLPFQFTRFYRSGVDYQTPIGFGWSHNFALRLVDSKTSFSSKTACESAHHDVFFINEHMDRIRFTYEGTTGSVELYTPAETLPLSLSHDPRELEPWILSAENVTYRFNAEMLLSSITDTAGHYLQIRWERDTSMEGGKVTSVQTTTDQVIYFHYEALDGSAPPALRCLSLIPGDCSDPLASFSQRPIKALSKMGVPRTEFDLIEVRHGTEKAFTFEYEYGDKENYTREFEDYLPSATVDGICESTCGSAGDDCHNKDICADAIASEVSATCRDPKQCWVPKPLGGYWYNQKCIDAYHQCVGEYTQRLTDSLPECRQECRRVCSSKQPVTGISRGFNTAPGASFFRTYGVPSDIAHNLTRVVDGDDRTIIVNGYGKNPLLPDFDRVNRQTLGLQSDKRLTFEYHDLKLEASGIGNPNIPAEGSSLVSPVGSFVPVDVCPRTCASGDSSACTRWSDERGETAGSPSDTQAPSYAVIVRESSWSPGPGWTDVAGSTQIIYYDQAWRTLREVHFDTGHTTDFNYVAGLLRGVRHPAGDRVCIDPDKKGRPTRIVKFPAPGYPGDQNPMVAELSYDPSGQLLEIVRDPNGPNPSGRHFVRDAFGRVAAVADQVDLLNARWTCFSYQDPLTISVLTEGKGSLNGESSRPGHGAPNGSRKPMAQFLMPQGQLGNLSRPPVALPETQLDLRARLSGSHVDQGLKYRLVDIVAQLHDFDVRAVVPFIDPHLSSVSNLAPYEWMFLPSGCTSGLDPRAVSLATVPETSPIGLFSARRRDVLPSTISRPDGSVVRLAGLSPAGAETVALSDVGGHPNLLETYVTFGDFGRPKESGRAANGNPVPSTDHITKFDAVTGRLLSLTINGQTVDLAYDGAGNLKTIRGPTFTRELNVDPIGRVQTIVDTPKPDYAPATQPRTTCFNFDIHSRLLDVVLPERNTQHYEYDSEGRLLHISRGFPVSVGSWASKCNPILDKLPILGGTWGMETLVSFEYDARGMPAAITREGILVQLVSDGFGRIIDRQVPDHMVERRIPLPSGETETIRTPELTHYYRSFDRLGRVEWEAAFSGPGDKLGFSKPSGPSAGLLSMREFQYDLVGRLTKRDEWRFAGEPPQSDSAGLHAITLLHHDDASNKTTVTDPEGRISIFRRDSLGRLAEVTLASGTDDSVDATYSYTLLGNEISVTTTPSPTSAGRRVQKYLLDSRGRVEQVEEDGSTIATYHRDIYGRIDHIWSRQEGQKGFDYDAYGRLVQVRQKTDGDMEARTTLAWNSNDALIRVVDPTGHQTSFEFDRFDRLARQVDDLGIQTFDYVPGTTRAKLRTRPDNSQRIYGYDLGGRISSITDVAGPDDSKQTRLFAYTPLGHLGSASVVGGTQTNFSYDSLGRRVFEANDNVPVSIETTYSIGTIKRTFNSAQSQSIELEEAYDALNRPKRIALNSKPIANFTYDQAALSHVEYGNTVRQRFVYDDRLRSVETEVASSNETLTSFRQIFGTNDIPLERETILASNWKGTDLFKVDAAGRVKAENLRVPNVDLPIASGGASDVSEDSILSLWDPTSQTSTFELDGVANWLRRDGAGALIPTIGIANQFSNISGDPVSYDSSGHMTRFKEEQYTWTPSGELAKASAAGSMIEFTYDALGRRVREKDGSADTFLVWDGSMIVGVGSGNDASSMRIRAAAGPDSTFALVDDFGGGKAHYLHATPDGSIFAATNDQGRLSEAYTYSSFGETTFFEPGGSSTPTSQINNRFLYQGQLYDPKLGLYYMRAREYKPSWGRFLSSDPLGIAGALNAYAFVGSRPLSRRDPTGLIGSKSPNSAAKGTWWNAVTDHMMLRQSTEDFLVGVSEGLAGPLLFVGDVAHFIETLEWGGATNLLRSANGQETVNRRSLEFVEGTVAGLAPHLLVGAGSSVSGVISDVRGLLSGSDAVASIGHGAFSEFGRQSSTPITGPGANLGPGAANIAEFVARDPTILLDGERLSVELSYNKVLRVFGPEAIEEIESRNFHANDLLASGDEVAIVGNNVEFSSQLSRRYIFENYPELSANSVSETRIPLGSSVDEAVPRFIGGRQSPFNQRISPSALNKWLGPMEFNAVLRSGLPRGTRIIGIDIVWLQ
jgi:RHS repeat-associated protein